MADHAVAAVARPQRRRRLRGEVEVPARRGPRSRTGRASGSRPGGRARRTSAGRPRSPGRRGSRSPGRRTYAEPNRWTSPSSPREMPLVNIRQPPAGRATQLPVQVARSSKAGAGCGTSASGSRVQDAQVGGDRVSDPGVAVPEVGVAERPRRVQEEQVVPVGRVVPDRPEVPDPVVGEVEHQTSGARARDGPARGAPASGTRRRSRPRPVRRRAGGRPRGHPARRTAARPT